MRFANFLLLITLISCDWGDRLTAIEAQQGELRTELTAVRAEIEMQREEDWRLAGQLESLDARFESFKREVAGVGTRQVKLSESDKFRTLFGNQSGFNARVTVSNRGSSQDFGKAAEEVFVKILRIPKPSDPVGDETAELPLDFETTEELDLSAHGASREVRVPCGFQMVGRANGGAKIDMLIKYDDKPCAA